MICRNREAHLKITGNTSFIELFAIEKKKRILKISVKNPTGSDTKWIPYDKGTYNKRNMITLRIEKNIAKSMLSTTSISTAM